MVSNVNDRDITLKVRRSADNTRQRPNGFSRHDPFNSGNTRERAHSFINETDFEWMSLNYRKVRAAKLSSSIRRMILVMFQENYKYFPSLRDIRDELINA